jgi:glutamyl/glutaminyl-tRNA synthetase
LTAGLLAWLDARSRGDRFVLRLEDLDPQRCRPEHAAMIVEDLRWLGLDWDEIVSQRTLGAEHEAAMDALEAMGALYPCSASREELKAIGRRSPDGGVAYDNRSRGRSLEGGWRASKDPIRARLPDERVELGDESGLDLAQAPAEAMGDPIVRRRDGSIAYMLAVVVDDAGAGVTRVVRGRDIAPSTATQVLLGRMLGLARPVYRHHLLLVDAEGRKLGKSYGAARASSLADDPKVLLGKLACGLGLGDGAPRTPHDLVASFGWSRVRDHDLVLPAASASDFCV